ncbi:MAG: hypothetical protein HY881_03700 [Deltaproteobacteria bacterium]|nr:hypothetical protein [Deltaproteobacteria bacterium]
MEDFPSFQIVMLDIAMKRSSFTAIIPLYKLPPFLPLKDVQYLFHQRDNALKELQVLSKSIKIAYANGEIKPIKIKFVENIKDNYRDDSFLGQIKKDRFWGFLKINSTNNFSKEDVLKLCGDTLGEASFQDKVDIYIDLAIQEICKTIYDLILCSNISKPGSIQAQSINFFVNGKYRTNNTGMSGNLWEFFLKAKEDGWPPIDIIDTKIVWAWLNSIPDFKNGLSKAKIGRAIGALSYIMKPISNDETHSILIWALLGLEAIYCNGGGYKAQLIQKTDALFGKRETHKKMFGLMYDYRSRLIHGDIDFPYWHNPYDGSDEYERFHVELWRATAMAVNVLLASLQKMALSNISELKFKYIIN